MAPTNGSTVVTESWDIVDFVIHKGHGVKGLSEKGLKSLPKQFHQPLEERFSEKRILDQSPEVAKFICDAAENWGFFQIVNHGVALEVLERVKEATHRFFALPAEEKRKYSKENSPTKNVRYGSSFAPHVERALEWKDFLSLFYVSEEETSAFWPLVCKDEMLEYMRSSE
ncbi:hypothetical protein CISIN_1g0442571mg, partial [Citrus sinensis]